MAIATSLIRLHVSGPAEDHLRRGHPWLYAQSIRDQNRPGEAGELAAVYDRRNRFLAIGLYDPDSPLRVRILHRGDPCAIDESWFARRLDEAVSRREGMVGEDTTGYRLIHGENDGWPGLVLDRYDATLVLKLYTSAWLPRLGWLHEAIARRLGPARLILRLSRNIRATAQTAFQLEAGTVLLGPPIDEPVVFVESGLRFQADVVRGQKTGFFLDQRENRRRVGLLADGREVLNAFSFSGGFSLYAARGGARAVTDLDLSAHALRSAEKNFALNAEIPGLAQCRHDRVKADAFKWLANRSGPSFDLIVLDPPSLAKREADREGAIRAYGRLASDAIASLRPKGILVAASCSAHVSAEEFFQAVRSAAHRTGRPFTELETAGPPPDHPATFPEGHYLKCIFLEFQGVTSVR